MMDINATNLYKVFKDFYTLTNTKIVLFDKDHEVLIEYPESDGVFCSLIYKNEYWKKKCADCDRKNIEICAKTEKTFEYECHLGLTEVLTPIYDTNGILGYVLFGQILADDENLDRKKSNLRNLFDEKDFCGINNAIDSIPVKSTEELVACVTVLQAIATYILSNQWVVPKRSEFIRRMDKFIEKNLEKEINVDSICNEFHIRRTRLYSIAKDYLGCSIALYIRKQRIKHAMKLLAETDDSINNIAFKVGFNDYGHFSRVFRQLQGIPARNYRKKMRSEIK